jgi:hypothetical protein
VSTHNSELAVVERAAWDHGEPITYIDYDNSEPDAGFICLTHLAPLNPDDSDLDRLITVCLHCLINQHPEIGQGLDLARQTHGPVVTGDHTPRGWLRDREFTGWHDPPLHSPRRKRSVSIRAGEMKIGLATDAKTHGCGRNRV